MQDERIPEEGEGVRRLNEDDDEVEAHRTGLNDDADLDEASRTGLTDDDEVEAHLKPRMGQVDDPGFKH
jgi:hypothetical protein